MLDQHQGRHRVGHGRVVRAPVAAERCGPGMLAHVQEHELDGLGRVQAGAELAVLGGEEHLPEGVAELGRAGRRQQGAEEPLDDRGHGRPPPFGGPGCRRRGPQGTVVSRSTLGGEGHWDPSLPEPTMATTS